MTDSPRGSSRNYHDNMSNDFFTFNPHDAKETPYTTNSASFSASSPRQQFKAWLWPTSASASSDHSHLSSHLYQAHASPHDFPISPLDPLPPAIIRHTPAATVSPHSTYSSHDPHDLQQSSPPPLPRSNKSHSRRQIDGHIPRPRNAFILYRSYVVSQGIIQQAEKDHREISKIVAELWRNLNEKDKNYWKKEAEEEKERHRQLYPDYRYTPQYKHGPGGGPNTKRTKTKETSTTSSRTQHIACLMMSGTSGEALKAQMKVLNTSHPPSSSSHYSAAPSTSTPAYFTPPPPMTASALQFDAPYALRLRHRRSISDPGTATSPARNTRLTRQHYAELPSTVPSRPARRAAPRSQATSPLASPGQSESRSASPGEIFTSPLAPPFQYMPSSIPSSPHRPLASTNFSQFSMFDNPLPSFTSSHGPDLVYPSAMTSINLPAYLPLGNMTFDFSNPLPQPDATAFANFDFSNIGIEMPLKDQGPPFSPKHEDEGPLADWEDYLHPIMEPLPLPSYMHANPSYVPQSHNRTASTATTVPSTPGPQMPPALTAWTDLNAAAAVTMPSPAPTTTPRSTPHTSQSQSTVAKNYPPPRYHLPNSPASSPSFEPKASSPPSPALTSTSESSDRGGRGPGGYEAAWAEEKVNSSEWGKRTARQHRSGGIRS